MIGSGYWSVGITVEYRYSGGGEYGWSARVIYCDDGFADDDPGTGRVSTEGILHTRYALRQGAGADPLTVAVDTVKADAERLGITWKDPHVYYQNDGCTEDPAPHMWRQLTDAQSERLGWPGIYEITPTGE